MNYHDFLESKIKMAEKTGFEVDDKDLNVHLFPFQRFIVKRALNAGKFATFADCGLGKTLMQLEFAHQVSKHTGGRALILTILAVKGQTVLEAEKFGIPLTAIDIYNYEQLDNIDCSQYSCVVLDESSILKNHEGVTKKSLIKSFEKTPYKLACTATPSPNDPMELGNHSEFLNVMTRNEMLAMYFIHDGGETAKWRLKGHGTKLFYQFVGTWAIMLTNPNDIGFPMDEYSLPGLKLIEHQIKTEKKENSRLYNDVAVSATNFNVELRNTKNKRMDLVAKIIEENPSENFIVWIKHDSEGEYLRSILIDAKEVKGSDSNSYKEKTLLGFANNEFRVLITKLKIASFGLNYQNCHHQIFASLDFSFEGLYQGIRRSYRFGQKEQVNIHLITTDTMTNVIQSIKKKQKQFETMQAEMSMVVNGKDSEGVIKPLMYSLEAEVNEYFHIERGDSIRLINEVPDNSLGLSIFSPPFRDLYTYSSHNEDLGNCRSDDEFFNHFSYLIEQLYQKMIPGRNVCVHCMDLPVQKGKEGYIGLRDFSGMLIKTFEKYGFIYHSRITIWKDPVVEMQRTKALGLLHKQVMKDSTMSRVGMPDYVLIFRKDGDRESPVTNIKIPVDLWQKYASPVWMDINYSKTLQGFRNGRDDNDEKHICPLQLPTIERLIHLYSNEGDTVFTPFMGIGSEVWQAVKMNRKGIGFELKESYYDLAKANLRALIKQKNQLQLQLQ